MGATSGLFRRYLRRDAPEMEWARVIAADEPHFIPAEAPVNTRGPVIGAWGCGNGEWFLA